MFQGFKNMFADKKDITKPTYNPLKDFGETGTEESDGYLSTDYINELNGQQAITEWDKMRKSDSTIRGLTQAVKLPLLSANWFIQAGTEEKKDVEIAEFVEDNLFNLKTKWQSFLSEAIEYRNFGFYYFEKIFKVGDDGMIRWEDFASRLPSAHLRWKMADGKPGVQQQVPTGDISRDNLSPSIPWDKLVYFVNDREGDNYQGVSVLRYCRQLWKYKQKMLKVIAVNAERYGIGVPVIGIDNMNAKDIALAENLAKNIRGNGESRIIKPKGMEISLLTPERDIIGDRMENAIAFYNKEMMRSYLASFMGLGDGAVGSFALSKDQTDFFMLALQSVAKTITGEINKHIKELVDLNFGDVEKYPKLQVTEIKSKDIESFTNMLKTLSEVGFISSDEKKMNDFIREELNLPEITDEEFEEAQQKKIEAQKQIQEGIEEKKEEEKKEEKVKKDTKLSEGSFFLAETTLKETLFQKSINEEEKFLQDTYKNKFEPAIEATEAILKKFLEKQYDRLDTVSVGGVKKIKRSGNQKIRTEMTKGVNKIMSAFKDKVENPRFIESIHRKSMNHAIALIKDVDRRVQLAEIMVNEGDFRSFITGYKSNMSGVVYNEGRRVKERIHDNLTQGVSLTLAKKQVADILFNRNVYKLSAITHPRALYRKTIQTQATSQGMIHYKALLPSVAVLGALGLSATVLYSIKTQQDWDKLNGEKDNINVVGGMGLQHNSLIYFMPLAMSELEEQEEISRQQRAELEEELNDI